MVLGELGASINAALKGLSSAPLIDEKVLDALLKDLCGALLAADVNVRLVQNLRKNIKQVVNLDELAAGLNKKKVIQKAVLDELVALVDPGEEPWAPRKGKSNVVMFVGLQVRHLPSSKVLENINANNVHVAFFSRALGKQPVARNSRSTTSAKDSRRDSFVRIHSEQEPLTSSGKMRQRPRSHTMAQTLKLTLSLLPMRASKSLKKRASKSSLSTLQGGTDKKRSSLLK